MSSGQREFDVVVWGATGFTGRLVAEFLHQRYGADGDVKWAIAGRNSDKLAAVRDQIGLPDSLPVIVADSKDRPSLDAMVARTKVVCTTVGPYALYGDELVGACVAAGTGYVDLAGEPQWIQRMIDRHQQQAESTGARIVNCCGFDSIPSDMGVYFLQENAMQQWGKPLDRIKLRVKAAKGGLSGGTFASMFNLMEEAAKDKSVAKAVKNPYALNPINERAGPRQPNHSGSSYDPHLEAWIAPFVMAGINTRVVHRANAIQDYPYGRDFIYDEAVVTGKGLGGRFKGLTTALGLGAFAAASSFSLSRPIVKKLMPDPGEGPNAEQREQGFFKLVLIGINEGNEVIRGAVSGDRDPGYGSTSKMLGESAVCLALDERPVAQSGGFWTPSAAMGDALLERLQSNAGLKFEIY